MNKPRLANYVQCRPCGHVWIGFYLPLPIRDAVRIMHNLTCPNCAAGSDKIAIFDSGVQSPERAAVPAPPKGPVGGEPPAGEPGFGRDASAPPITEDMLNGGW